MRVSLFSILAIEQITAVFVNKIFFTACYFWILFKIVVYWRETIKGQMMQISRGKEKKSRKGTRTEKDWKDKHRLGNKNKQKHLSWNTHTLSSVQKF